jgi:hypothetical protein
MRKGTDREKRATKYHNPAIFAKYSKRENRIFATSLQTSAKGFRRVPETEAG